MEFPKRELEPMSPLSQYFNTPSMCVSILGVLELENPISYSDVVSAIHHLILPSNPRFSSLMVKESSGERKWKRIEVNPEDHIYNPSFLEDGLSLYDTYFDEYISKIAKEKFSESIPLWEVHIFRYPTTHAPCHLIFKIHHSIADGFSIMSTVLSMLKRADDPSLPLTFPSRQRSSQQSYNNKNSKNYYKFNFISSSLLHFISSVGKNVSNFGWSITKSTFLEDDLTPIKLRGDSMQLIKPMTVSTITFSLDKIKQIKTKLNMTVNDVLTGIIFYGIRLYMQEIDGEASKESNSSALILLNTRKGKAYRTVQEMVKKNSDVPWGNKIAFLPVPIPKLTDSTISNPLNFLKEAQEMIMRQRKPLSVFIVAKMFELLNFFIGPEKGARFMKQKLMNSSIMISNMIGPIEKLSFANTPIKSLYFTVPGIPQSLLITIVSYMGDLKIVFGAEKCFIDQQKLKSCMEDAFEKILRAST